MDRRNFFRKATSAAVLAALPSGLEFPGLEIDAKDKSKSKPLGQGMELPKGSKILFTGDSITDGNRERKYYRLHNHVRSMGHGYVQITSTRLNYDFPDRELKIYNTGINGDTVAKMMERLDTDCIKLRPDVVSILVGVNDFNVEFQKKGKGDPEKFRKEYSKLLSTIKRQLPKVRFVVGEPYAIRGAREKVDLWYPDFIKYQEVAASVAKEFDAVYIPYQSVYDSVIGDAPERYFSTDGVHPSLAGVRLMSDAWLSYVNPR